MAFSLADRDLVNFAHSVHHPSHFEVGGDVTLVLQVTEPCGPSVTRLGQRVLHNAEATALRVFVCASEQAIANYVGHGAVAETNAELLVSQLLVDIHGAESMQSSMNSRNAALGGRCGDTGLLEAPDLLAGLDKLADEHAFRVSRIGTSEQSLMRVVVAERCTTEHLPVVEAHSRACLIEHF